MKAFKKLAGMALAVCLMVTMLTTVVFAADGVLMFSDPSTKVGENVDIDLVVRTASGTVGDVSVSMKYDTEALEFVSGDGFTADGSGGLTYSGTGSSAELRVTMTFRALRQTNTTISVSDSSATLSSGDELNLEEGSSAVTIAAADDGTTSVEPSETTAAPVEATDITVDVNGTSYNFSEAFTTSDIPEGYSETTMALNGEDRKFVSNDAGVSLGYLVDGSGAGSFFLFNSEDATFAPFAQLTISDTTSLIPLDHADQVSLPENYQQSTLTVQDYEFPVWSDPAVSDRFYVIDALNTRTGEEGMYQYDSEDGTYQYFEAPAEADSSASGAVIPGKIGELLGDKVLFVLGAAVVLCLLFFILMIVFAVKLVHRNQELDDLYDEYDIPFDDEGEVEDKKDKKASAKSSKSEETYDDDEFEDDDYDDDDYDDDDYDDEYDDDYDDEDDDEYEDDNEDDDDISFIDL